MLRHCSHARVPRDQVTASCSYVQYMRCSEHRGTGQLLLRWCNCQKLLPQGSSLIFKVTTSILLNHMAFL
ncbi:Uncharacterized protein TCM_038650 [Theobroma cacao]|uniref:Uncharacterized protein n=1 Tax=Theobroma cacao TaxID=3641 RepID=A0A061GRB5_THECC|nr:Uncharacterized protein TCM_038650 [Theobroma cacao]